ncbi:lipoprotein insertase outer membrane protein LolB [Glaciecola sp. 2405UD65-10]|uniref:lipoprotein insertase outer membrane protein LolB n=1 Tax=Glaciecola sp. 2405UD65-10 TaxID=3397244 RepID=UPI003B5B7ED6
MLFIAKMHLHQGKASILRMLNKQFRSFNCVIKRQFKTTTLLFLISCLLVACSTKPTLEQQAVISLNQNLAQLTHWKLSGKIAWISATERKSAYINWQQQGEAFSFSVTNILGISGGTMIFDGEKATLKADGEQYTDPSPAQLVYRLTGWDLPLSDLQYWIKGASGESGRFNTKQQAQLNTVSSIVRYDNGLIKQLVSQCKPRQVSCSPWQIDYQAYKNSVINGVSYQLPSAITLRNLSSNAMVKIKVSKWSV